MIYGSIAAFEIDFSIDPVFNTLNCGLARPSARAPERPSSTR